MRSFLWGLVLVCAAFSAAAESDDGFGERVRAYILENPEVILEALTILSEREREAEMTARIAEHPWLFEEAPRHGLGRPDAPIRVVEFFDFKCMPCKAVHPRLEAFVEAHPEVRIEMLHLPILTPGSERAARFALAVRAVAGAEAHERVHQQIWEMQGPLREARLEALAVEEGLDFGVISAEMQSETITARITRNRDFAIALEVLGTPAFVTPSNITFGSTDVPGMGEIWLSR